MPKRDSHDASPNDNTLPSDHLRSKCGTLQAHSKNLSIVISSIGENIKLLIERPDGTYCFRLHRDRIYYVSEDIMKRATNVCRENLISLGVCFGKFTKTKKFRLHITALDYLAPYAKVIDSLIIIASRANMKTCQVALYSES